MNNYYDNIFVKLILNEGGYVNDADDTGKETYLGMSRVHNPDLKMWKLIDEVKAKFGTTGINARLKAIPAIVNEVKIEYKKRYWDPIKLDELNSEPLVYQIFDHAVNAGVGAAISLANELVGLPKSTKYSVELGTKLKNYGIG